MGLVYADTSALFSYFHPKDEFSIVVTEAARAHSPDFVYWTFLRYELRHNIRRSRVDSEGEIAWKAVRAAERTQARLRWHPELKCDSLLEAADDLTAQNALKSAAGSADFLHVAAASRLVATVPIDEFWTCDSDQANLARTLGMRVRLFEL
jgi:predicted nucleic acid-binding protein